MILPANEKPVRLNEVHFFCPGEGCDARLGKRTEEGTMHDVQWRFELERRYTDEPHATYPNGLWWRKQRGGYANLPSARDARRVARALEETPAATGRERYKAVANTGFADVVRHLAGPGLRTAVLGDDWDQLDERDIRKAFQQAAYFYGEHRRESQLMPALPTGTHVVVCYRCGGNASIDVRESPTRS